MYWDAHNVLAASLLGVVYACALYWAWLKRRDEGSEGEGGDDDGLRYPPPGARSRQGPNRRYQRRYDRRRSALLARGRTRVPE